MAETVVTGKLVAGVICIVHEVERGETLTLIAGKYKTTIAVIAALNNIADPNKIFAGQKLYVPCATAKI